MTIAATSDREATPNAGRLHGIGPVSIPVLGWSLSVSFVISFVLCVLGYLLLPSMPVLHQALAIPLPGFQLNSWPRFFLGLAESFAWGWYIALVFGSLYNFFAVRLR